MNDSTQPRPIVLLPALLALLAACQVATPETRRQPLEVPSYQRHDEASSTFDVDHYALDLRLYPELRSVRGECTVRLYPRGDSLDRVTLDFAGLKVNGVTDPAGRPLLHDHVGEELTIELPEPVAAGQACEITVAYSGQPAKGLWFSGDVGGVPTQVFTQGEAEDARWWFPCQDFPADRASSEVRVTMPANWRAVAAGELVEREAVGDVVTEHWRMDFPHPTYLVTLVAGRFEVLEEDWNGIPLMVLVDPSYASLAGEVFASTPSILEYLGELTGLDYPYPKYSQACVDNFPFGGMENISATTLTDTVLVGQRGLRDGDADGLIAHEAAHQWFGNLLTCRDWSHIWLNESFATYAELLYVEDSEGADAFRAEVRDTQESYLSKDVGDKRRPVVWNAYRDPIDLFFGGQVYPGGAARLHLLRFVVGDTSFFEGIRAYVRENAGRSVVTADFQSAMETASGQDLGWFFEQWFRYAGFPEFQVSWSYDEVRNQVRLDVVQVQRPGNGTPEVFETPVDVEIKTRSGAVVRRLHVDDRSERFVIDSAEEPVWVRFDKHGWIPKRISSEKEPEEWLLIAAQDDDVNGRRDALRALGALARDARAPETKRLYLAQISNRLRQDPVEAVRLAAARALGEARGAEARANLEVAARKDASAAVRTAALEGLAQWGVDPDLHTLGEEAWADGYSWRTMAAAAKLVVAARPEGAYEWLTRQLFTPSPHDVLQAHLFEVLATVDHPGVRDQLLRWARDEALSDRARTVAVREVARISPGSTSVARSLLPLLDSPRYRVRTAALEALAAYPDDTGSTRALEAYYPRSVFPREKRIIEGVLGL